MKRILITNGIQLMAEQYRDGLFKNESSRFVKPKDKLKELRSKIYSDKANIPLWREYTAYINAIIERFDSILILHPKKFENYKKDHFSMLDDKQLKEKIFRNNNTFYDLVVKAMRYKEVRETEIVKYIEKLGIKTCVYCNAQYANTIHYLSQLKASYEIDHYKPKSKYPFLCISFFNMQPSCASCNRWKSDDESSFNLYTDDYKNLNPFLFSLKESSIIKYMLVQSSDVLNIMIGSQEPGLVFNHNKRFHVDALYQSFKDEAEELLWKYKTRNDTYINQLIDSFQKKFPYKRDEIKRFLYGFYSHEKDIHKRPLTKMKQDVAKQLKLV